VESVSVRRHIRSSLAGGGPTQWTACWWEASHNDRVHAGSFHHLIRTTCTNVTHTRIYIIIIATKLLSRIHTLSTIVSLFSFPLALFSRKVRYHVEMNTRKPGPQVG